MNNQELQQKIEELERKIKFLEASATIPKPVEDAFRERLRLENVTAVFPSLKSAISEAQAVNEAGTANYSVLKNPDGFLQLTVNGTLYYIPAWT